MVRRIHGGTSGRAWVSVRQVDDVNTDEHAQIHKVASRQSMLGTGLDRSGPRWKASRQNRPNREDRTGTD